MAATSSVTRESAPARSAAREANVNSDHGGAGNSFEDDAVEGRKLRSGGHAARLRIGGGPHPRSRQLSLGDADQEISDRSSAQQGAHVLRLMPERHRGHRRQARAIRLLQREDYGRRLVQVAGAEVSVVRCAERSRRAAVGVATHRRASKERQSRNPHEVTRESP